MSDPLYLYNLIEQRLVEDPDATAFIIDGNTISVAEFDQLCRRLDSWLAEQGIGQDDVVAVWLVNRLEWLALLFALARRGATLAAINTRYRREEVQDILHRSGARLLVMQSVFRNIAFAEVLSQVDGATLPALEKIVLLDEGDLPATLIGKPVIALDSERPAAGGHGHTEAETGVILFTTSGTTSKPKLVRQPQRSHTLHARDNVAYQGFDEDGAVLLASLPLCGTFGLNNVLPAFAAGAPVILQQAFEADEALQLMIQYRVTHLFGSDEMFRRLIDGAADGKPFAHARRFGFGAFSSSFDDYARAAWDKGVPLYGLYGSSEVLALFAGQPHYPDVERRIEGGGMPIPKGAQVRVRDTDSGELLPVGESGELEITSPSCFLDYLNNPEATRKALTEDGWFRTGDLGYLRDDGSFVYQSRMGDAIRLSGFLVNPAEIEALLKAQPGVDDAQVVAVDIDGTPRAVAFVVAAGEQPEPAALIATCRNLMASFKAPARIWFVEDYPVTVSANGAKVQRNKLRDQALALLAGESH